jgi:hypothetical protein
MPRAFVYATHATSHHLDRAITTRSRFRSRETRPQQHGDVMTGATPDRDAGVHGARNHPRRRVWTTRRIYALGCQLTC